jgi:phosphatidylserine/phosphatidylglycerophosphate/cardiolipin synthase-like enzyme
VKEIERLYLDMIAAARHTLYIENQYFTAPRLAAALEKRLGEPDGPEIVLLVRLLSHGWLEEATMHVLRTRLIQRLQKADRYGRFKVYYPHVPDLAEGCCVDVHSKLMVVDDRMLRIGSSNLCNRSMGVDSECDVVLEALGRAARRRLDPRLPRAHPRRAPRRATAQAARSPRRRQTAAFTARSPRSPAKAARCGSSPTCPTGRGAGERRGPSPTPRSRSRCRRCWMSARSSRRTANATPAWGKLALLLLAIISLTLLWRARPWRASSAPRT